MTPASSWTLLHARVHSILRQRQILQQNQSVLIAVSGGQDSLCLMKLLLDLQPKWKWHLAIAHCDHRWSSDVGMAEHVQTLAKAWHLPFYLKVAPEMKETEAAARKWRYSALVEIAQEQGFGAIATGHTQSDRAETLLYNLIRGSGTTGLQALCWQRSLTTEIELVRPLLTVSRQETEAFCGQFQLPVWEDVANTNLDYARSRIRAEVFPYLKTHFNPQVETTLAQTAEILRAEVDYLETTAHQLLQQAISPTGWGQPEARPSRLNRQTLRAVPLALQRRVMRQFLQQQLPTNPTFEHIEALTELIRAPNRSRTSSLPGKAIAEVSGDWIILSHPDR